MTREQVGNNDMKLLATSDWHIDAVTNGVTRYEEIDRAIDTIVATAKRLKVELFVFLGDLCNGDGWCPQLAVRKAQEVALELSMCGIPSAWVAGNHDVVEDGLGTTMLTPMWALENMSERVEGLARIQVAEEPRVLAIGKVRLLFMPFTPSSHRYDPRKLVRELPKEPDMANVLFGHLNIEGITSGSETLDMPRGREVFWPLKEIRKCLPGAVCIGGHYHEAQDFNGVHIVGSLARLTHGEEQNVPGYLLVEV
jgi:DNA repair exonuclease SbcCD nuclease subunit